MPMPKIPEVRPELQDAAFRFLTIAMRKYASRPEDRAASAENIIRYAAYLAIGEIGRDKAEHLVLRAIDDYSKFRGE